MPGRVHYFDARERPVPFLYPPQPASVVFEDSIDPAGTASVVLVGPGNVTPLVLV
jgi:hypothetical protein